MYIIKGVQQTGKIFYAKKHLISGILSFSIKEFEKEKATKFDFKTGTAEIEKYKERIRVNPLINYDLYFEGTEIMLEEV